MPDFNRPSGLRKFEPLPLHSPVVGTPCQACHEDFKVGDEVTLVSLGPGSDPEQRQKARQGRYYTGVGVAVHWACATGEEEDISEEDIHLSGNGDGGDANG